MKKDYLSKEEINKFATMYERIEKVMSAKGYDSIPALSAAIAKKRGGASPHDSIYSKMQNPPRLSQPFYNMSMETLYVIADALDVSTDYLLGITEIKKRVNDIEINSLGLSDDSLFTLKRIKEQSECYDSNKIKSTSIYYRNPYDKELDILNWIIEHIKVNENEEYNDHYDFLTSLYHLIMLNFNEYKSAIVEAVMSQAQINTFDEWEQYSSLVLADDCLFETDTKQDKEQRAKKLAEARRKVVENDGINRYNRQILEDIKNGIIYIEDSVTYDEVRTSLTDPENVFRTNIMNIIEEWHNEFLPLYEKKKARQKEDYGKALSLLEDTPLKEQEEVPDELLYRRPALGTLSESEMKLFMLLEYLEEENLRVLRINDDGKVDFYKEESSFPDGISMFVKAAEEEGVGLFLGTDGCIYYSAGKAVSTRERNEKLFYQYTFPHFLKQLLKKKKPGIQYKMRGYYDPALVTEELTDEEIDKIYEVAEAEDFQWEINGYTIEIYTPKSK